MSKELSEILHEGLKKYFGFDEFKEGQEETLISLLNRHSTLSILPTGTGKSLCYQLFAKITGRRVLVISPLISLMQDQVEQMKYNKLTNVVALTSSLSREERNYILHNLEKYQFIFASPEILKNEYIFQKIKTIGIELLVVDEAHCIVEWGPDFRPDYLLLGEIREKLKNPLVLALTATATPKVANEITRELNFNSEDKVIRYSVDRPNIMLATETLDSEKEKNNRLIELVSTIKGPGLIYFSSKKKADEIAELLNKKTRLKVASYHADLNLEDRYSVQHQFINNKLDLICATSAFGMGVNKKDIRYVIHYHLPGDLESYVQEIGRAGRDGKQSIAILLYCLGDENIQYQILKGSLPTVSDIKYYAEHKELLHNIKNEEFELLKAFFAMNISADDLLKFFAERKRDKNQALIKMIDYINSDKCKRQYILDYFQDLKKIKHGENCCTYNKNYNLKQLGLKLQEQTKEKIEFLDYKELMKKLFAI